MGENHENVIVEKARIRQRMQYNEKTIGTRRELNYSVNLMKDAKAAKEIRIFHMQQFLYDIFQEKYNKYEGAYYATRPIRLGWYFINYLCEAARDCVVYIYAAFKLLKKEIMISDFYLYTVSINQMYLAIKGVFDAIITLTEKMRYISHIRSFLLLDTSDLSEEAMEDICDKRLEIEFRNVYFKYDGQNEYVLKDINLKINDGDIIGIIGENGAGKSTLIKLLLRLYKPCRGTILLNGVDINEYSFAKYIKLFSVMFQEDFILPYSIRENVLFEKSEESSIVLDDMYKSVFLDEKISSLKAGENSTLSRELNDDGIELSGGEQQRLMVIRSMVKQAEFYVFDEPISAISPLAEYKVMQNLFEHINKKTCIVISHRLSFVNRCKKILLDIILDTSHPGDASGLKFVENIRRVEHYNFTPIIFVTSLEDARSYTYENLHCYSFIEKPFDVERVKRTIEQCLKFPGNAKDTKTLYFRKDGIILAVEREDIVYAESIDHIMHIHTCQGDVLKIPYTTLKKLLDDIDSLEIIQCSRNTIVNKKFVQNVDITNRIIQLKGDFGRIEIGIMFKKYVKECFS